MHIMEDCVFVEIVDVDTGLPVADGQAGNMVVTILHRNLPPVIRYNVRDLGRILHTERMQAAAAASAAWINSSAAATT